MSDSNEPKIPSHILNEIEDLAAEISQISELVGTVALTALASEDLPPSSLVDETCH